MNDAHLILGVPRGADDRQIRQAYLAAIKVATPDTDPRRFQTVNAAYEAIKDESHRLQSYLFDISSRGDSPLDAFMRHARARSQFKPPPFEALKEYLRSCSKT